MDAADRKNGYTVIPTPPWVLVARIFQIIMSVIAVGMAGWWIHDLYRDALGFVIACGLFTWVTALYTILSERAAACRRAYNTWAVLALEGTLAVFWLAAMGATADARAAFRYDVVASCTSDGSAVNSGHCTVVGRREAAGVASHAALAVLSGIAAVCALVMLLFVAPFAYTCHVFRRAARAAAAAPPDAEKPAPPATEMLPRAPPPPPQQQQQQPPQPPAPVAAQWHQAAAPQTGDTAYYTADVGSPGTHTTPQNTSPYYEPGQLHSGNHPSQPY